MRGGSRSHAVALHTAVAYYLNDADSGRAAWKLPLLGREAPPGEPLELELDEGLYGRLAEEAERQDATPELLAVHALAYFLTDFATGRAAARLGDAIARDAEAN